MKNEDIALAIDEAIIEGKLKEALDLLAKNVDNEADQEEIILLKARLYNYQKRLNRGTASYEHLDLELNQIRSSILSLNRHLHAVEATAGNEDRSLELLEAIHDRIKATHNAYLAQCNIRNLLMDSLRERFDIKEVDHYYHVFAHYFDQMTDKEKRYHRMIRGYTQNVIRENHQKTYDLIRANPNLKTLVPRLEELEQHLIVWHSKYESLLLPDESISLVYVGFEEGVKFPTGLEHDLNKYIASHS
jgi:chromosome segregation ATPase